MRASFNFSLRAQYGTTKYCSAFLRGENCNNKNCSFLHETGEDGQNTSLQNEPISGKPTTRTQFHIPALNQTSSQRPASFSHQPSASSQQMRQQSTADEVVGRKGSADGSALPSTASWANKDVQFSRARRESQAGGKSTPSPRVSNATPSNENKGSKRRETATPPTASLPPGLSAMAKKAPSQAASSGKSSPKPPAKNSNDLPRDELDSLIAAAMDPRAGFVFDDSAYTKEQLAELDRMPSLIDPFGGVKRRARKDREAAERLEAQSKLPSNVRAATETMEEEDPTSGSLQLGGEPEDNPRVNSRTFGGMNSVIGRPAQQLSGDDQFQNLNINGQDLTAQQRQQLAVLTNVSQAPGLGQNSQSFGAPDQSDLRPNLFQNQASQYEPVHGHTRQSSRFSFANDSAKPNVNARYQQQSNAGHQHFYPSAVQGPPPGLKMAGTPPISGGGMFAQGHGFTSNMSTSFANKDANPDLLLRGRSGTQSGHDVSKREYLFSLQNTHRSPPPPAPAPGLLNSLYDPYAGAYQDPGLVKQKKKGKKHRHANTSSSGGGVADLVDPSILQARLQQGGVGGQGQFGGQSQGGYNQSNMMYSGGYNSRW